MAVVSYYQNKELIKQRAFMVPKRAAELKYWYKAANKVILEMPPWESVSLEDAIIEVGSIILQWQHPFEPHHLVVIDRKKQLL